MDNDDIHHIVLSRLLALATSFSYWIFSEKSKAHLNKIYYSRIAESEYRTQKCESIFVIVVTTKNLINDRS